MTVTTCSLVWDWELQPTCQNLWQRYVQLLQNRHQQGVSKKFNNPRCNSHYEQQLRITVIQNFNLWRLLYIGAKRASSQPLKILHNLQIWNSFYWWSKTMNSLKNPVLLMCISSEEKERNEVCNVVATSYFNRIYWFTDVSCFLWLQSLAHMGQKNRHQRLVRKCYYVTVSLW